MNKNIIKLLITIILVASIWQLNVLAEKFKPLAVNVSINITDIPQEGSQDVLTYTAKEDTTQLEEVVLQPERIVIEKANIDLPVVQVPLVNGTWEVNSGVANYAMGTSLISERSGNVGIYAHDKIDGFENIKHLTSGDQITVYSGDKKAIYEVNKSSVVKPEVVDVFYPTPDPTLTLVTCDGVYSEKRYIVISKLINISPYEN